ncbi:MAG: 2-hydroxyacid dehydrogenase [Rhodospirillales bacterium]|uniref:2-hydroxyacid dehydrogenase n=1 Tax=Thalassospira sp. 11-3 TaxID=2135614 RepID=UPI000D76321C|nr:2-hydroxyacid dehydrogenase [Thalassospira sp. 11-3]MBL4843215.1 2-hydroxyacid dehydrogenase [Thalassospira sp.]MBR9778394.1 2-hydroxyacid dehydrogenase [Rhodospirillales bacterium]MBR9816403.1 2-hydroxyacid dehydrogenase [Rhodospirillales bacterium]PXX30806.1 lactate dehydrogenase-like 2-hydroxyacid dehydrogenase [Thalassospira sp. 11-3]
MSRSDKHILVISSIRPRHMEELAAKYELHRWDQASDKDAFLANVADRITALVSTAGVGVPTELIAKLPNLKVITSFGVGYDAIDIAACTARGIRVSNTPDVLNDDVADTAIMLLLATLRRLVVGDHWARSGQWSEKGAMPLTTTARGKKLGIVGLGRIGQAIAARAEPIGMEIGYFGRSKKPVDYHYEADLIGLANWADVLMVSCPGGTATQGIINADVLKALGPRGFVINIARGSVIDEPALIAALRDGVIAGAGLDVFHNEPHMDRAFAGFDNVVLYPHNASGTVETRDAMAQMVVDNLAQWFAEGTLVSPVN